MIINLICILYILFIVIFHQIGFITNIKINNRQYMFLLITFGLCYSNLGSQMVPPPTWDLFHHYNEIDNMRIGGIEFTLKEANYKELFVINFLFYIVSLFSNNSLIVFITLFIEYMIFTYITCDLKKKYDKNNSIAFSINFFLFFALVNIVLSISGIRNVFAFSIASLAIYIDLIKKRKNILTYILYIIPVFIHPSTIIVPIIRFFSLNKNIYKLSPLLLFWGWISDFISNILMSTSIGALKTAGNLLEAYEGNHNIYKPYYPLIFVNCIFAIVILIACIYMIKLKSSNFSKDQLSYISFIILYIFVALGSLYNVLIFNRMLYGLGYLVLPVIPIIMQILTWKIKFFFILICIFFITGVLMHQGQELYYGITYYK